MTQFHQPRNGRSPLGRRNNRIVPPQASVIAHHQPGGVKGVGRWPPSLRDGCAALDTPRGEKRWMDRVRLLTRYGKLFREATTRHG